MKKKILGLFTIILFIFSLSVVSASAMTRDQAVNWAKTQANNRTAFDVDGLYGVQCSDFASAYINYIIYGDPYYWKNSGGKGFTTYMGYNYYGLTYPSGWQKIANTASFVPEPGDIVCFAAGTYNSAGHVAVAIEGSTTSVIKAIDQDGYTSAPTRYSTLNYYDNYMNIQGVIRPKWDSADTTAPTITKVWFSDVTETSYKVHATITDNVGVTTTGFIHWSGRNGKDDQEWVETSYNSSSKTTTTTVLASKHNNELGTYYSNAHAYDAAGNHSVAELGYGVYLEKYLDLGTSFNASIKNTTVGKALTCDSSGNVTSRTYTGAQNQIWKFTKQSDKTYKIQNVGTGLCLDVENGSTEVGAKVLGYKSHAGDNQKWYIQGAQGSYRLRAKSCWCVLDLYGLNKNDGAAFDMYGSNGSDAQRFTITTISTVTKPVIAPVNIAGGKNVAITCATSGATIYYTTDGSTPTTSSKKYTTAFNVTSTATIKAIAVKSGYTNSEVASSTLTITKAAAPTITANGSAVTLASATSGATIYYTTNGSAPTTSSTKYTATFNVPSGATVKAIAVANGYSTSDTSSKTITNPMPFTVVYKDGMAEITNTAATEQKVTVIVVKYNNSTVDDMTSTQMTFAAGEKRTLITGNGEYKVFIWDSLDSMIPLAK